MRVLSAFLILAVTALLGCSGGAPGELDWKTIDAEDFPYVLEAPGLEDPVGVYYRADERYGRVRVVLISGSWHPPYNRYPVAGLQISASGGALMAAPRLDDEFSQHFLNFVGEREWRMVSAGRTTNRFGPAQYYRIVAEESDDCVFFTQTWGSQRSRYVMDGYYCLPLEIGLTPELIQAVIDGVGEKKG